MRQRFLTIFLALAILFAPGCMLVTQRVYKDLQKISDPRKEFMDPSFGSKNEIFKGAYVGTVVKKGVEYDQFQFAHILAEPDANGPRRILEALVPRQAAAKAEIFETAVPAKGNGSVFWFTRQIDKDQYAARDVPAVYFKTYYPRIRPAAYVNNSVNVDMTPGLPENDSNFTGDYGYVVYRLSHAPDSDKLVWKPFQADIELHWVVRNSAAFDLNRARYLYSVPFDMLTFPIQMVIFPFLK